MELGIRPPAHRRLTLLTINKHDFLDLKQAGLASEKRLSGFYFCPRGFKNFFCMYTFPWNACRTKLTY